MKLKTHQTVIETGNSETVKKIGNYSIDDASKPIIFDILRNRMYASAIRAIMQEVSCNARDANREAGRADLPIEIKLPNRLDNTFYIRDFGIGITPERMENVFLKYGGSTKREDNHQTGGFGLGAKTPFAYSDTFSIVTITDKADETGNEDDRGTLIKRQYIALIDESKTGEINLMDEGKPSADEKQGTTIVLNCKPGDETSFRTWLVNTCKYWPIKPIVRGVDQFEWKEYKTLFDGKGWYILEREKSGWNYDNEFCKPVALVDGIPYEIKTEYVFGGDDMDGNMTDLFSFPIRLVFEIGEIELNTSREDIQYTQATVNRIEMRLQGVMDELQTLMKKKIAKCKNLWDANIQWHKLSGMQNSILSECEWKGITVKRKNVNVCRTYNGITMKRFERQTGSPKMRTAHGWDYMNEDSMLVVDDTGCKQPSKLRITTLLKDNPKVNMIYAITVTDWDNGADKKDKNYMSAEKNWKQMKKDLHLSKMGMVKLSEVEKAKTPKQPKIKGASVPVTIKKYTNHGHSYGYGSMWSDTNQGDIKLSDKGRVYVVLYNRTAYYPTKFDLKDKSGKEWWNNNIGTAKGQLGVDVYGVPMRYVKKLGNGWIPLEDKLSTEIAKLSRDKSFKGLADEIEYTGFAISSRLNQLWERIRANSFLKMLDDKDGLMFRYISLSEKVTTIGKKHQKLVALQDILGSNGDDNDDDNDKGTSKLKTMYDELFKRYPLSEHLTSYQVRNIPSEELAFYFNAKDREHNAKKK
jgi:hypothetical protein